MQKGGADLVEQLFRMATVVDLFSSGTAQIKFNGESEASEKEYAFLSSYKPELNDSILVSRIENTWIILGRVSHKEAVSNTKCLELDEKGGFDLSRTNGWQILGNAEVYKDFNHSGLRLTFFGGNPVEKKTLSTVAASGDVTGVQVRSWINNIINLLKRYNLT